MYEPQGGATPSDRLPIPKDPGPAGRPGTVAHVIPPPLTRLQALIPPTTPIEVAHDGHMWRVCLGPNASLLVSNIAQALSVWAKTARLPLVSPMLLDRAVDEGDHE